MRERERENKKVCGHEREREGYTYFPVGGLVLNAILGQSQAVDLTAGVRATTQEVPYL